MTPTPVITNEHCLKCDFRYAEDLCTYKGAPRYCHYVNELPFQCIHWDGSGCIHWEHGGNCVDSSYNRCSEDPNDCGDYEHYGGL